MGLPAYPPNREGLEFLRAEVFPRLVQRVPEARLVVIGGTIDWRAPWLVNPGRVPYDDIPAILRACDVCVAPIFSGSGTRVKILEAMAARRPVVSTSKGLEGIAATPGEQVIIADDGAAFSESIAGLLADPSRARALGEAGRRLVEAFFSWPALARRFWEYVADAGLALPASTGDPGERN
jgi:glycosyltransferase involved in cell wall biosynthesis